LRTTAESLLETPGFNAKDQMERFLLWKREAMKRRPRNGAAERRRQSRAGDLSLARDRHGRLTRSSRPQRCEPSRTLAAALYGLGDRRPLSCWPWNARGRRTRPVVLDACRYYAAMIVGALRGAGVSVASNR
jgi:hypothetical protein